MRLEQGRRRSCRHFADAGAQQIAILACMGDMLEGQGPSFDRRARNVRQKDRKVVIHA